MESTVGHRSGEQPKGIREYLLIAAMVMVHRVAGARRRWLSASPDSRTSAIVRTRVQLGDTVERSRVTEAMSVVSNSGTESEADVRPAALGSRTGR